MLQYVCALYMSKLNCHVLMQYSTVSEIKFTVNSEPRVNLKAQCRQYERKNVNLFISILADNMQP